jgi:hypothetical protein
VSKTNRHLSPFLAQKENTDVTTTLIIDAYRKFAGKEFDALDKQAQDFAAGWRAAARAVELAPVPVVFPHGVMGIPPTPPGTVSTSVKPRLSQSIAGSQPLLAGVAKLIIEYGDARQAGDASSVQAAFRALLEALPGAAR